MVQEDPYAQPPKHLRDKILRANWSKLNIQVRQCYYEVEDDSPTEEETQIETVKTGKKWSMLHQAEINIAKKLKPTTNISGK